MINKTDSYMDLYRNLPNEFQMKFNYFKNKLINENREIELIIISGDTRDNIMQIVSKLGGKYEDLGYGYGIITIDIDKVLELEKVDTIEYIEFPKSLYLSDGKSNKAACVQSAQSTFEVEGKGIVIGFIDSGIDYLHPAFKNEDGTTRIEYIYDLSLGGKIFNKNQINEAIKSEDPYSIVPSNDIIDHGTHVAGIACGGGNIPPLYYGVAPKSSIMMVKGGRGKFVLSTQIMRGLKFLVDKGKELAMPLVVNISLSTNDGAHNGKSLLEKYISTVCDLERITVVIAAGNEGDASHHVGGNLLTKQDISINVAEDETSLEMSLYKTLLSEISIKITNPTGKTTGDIILKEGINETYLDGDTIVFYVSGPKPFDLLGEIIIGILPKSTYLIAGEWTFTINHLNSYKGNYDIWLPISEGVNKNTKFLRPSLFNTLGIPATVNNVISVGSYNYVTNTISPFSGRGENGDICNTKPEIIAPGEGIYSSVPNDGYDVKSGTSMAAPHIAGIAALLMEWGIVKGNDKFLYGERLKSYLLRGAKRDRPSVIYPNSLWGYGTVCAYESFEILRTTLNIPMKRDSRSGELIRRIVEYTGDIENALKKYPDIQFRILDASFAILGGEKERISEVVRGGNEIVLQPEALVYTLNNVSPVESSGASLFHENPYISLNGRKVLVGILDTGIDYMSPEFMKEDDTTRIFSIWDQSLGREDFVIDEYGTIFTEEQINNAISTGMKGGDPYTIVGSKDEIGHGTMVAGLIGGRGKNPEFLGAAPDCNFIMVKLKEASKSYLEDLGITKVGTGRYENVDIILGIQFILIEAKKRNMPVLIYIPLGCNLGGHDGSTVLERYIDDMSKRRGLVIVTCTGNEGDSDTHTTGVLSKTGDIKTIELKVPKNQNDLFFEIWCNKPDKVSLSIVSPSGEIIEKIPAKLNKIENIKFVFEGTEMSIEYLIPEEVTGDELIKIKAKNLKEGLWQFKLIGEYIVNGRYDAWLPQRVLLEEDTKFLNSNQYITATIPSTSRLAISVGYYNQNNNATVGKSGRGYTRDDRVKPDIVAGGISALVMTPGGGSKVASGSSIAGAVVAGCCALLIQWGIIEKNDPAMYSVKLRTYLIRGTEKRAGDVYPNREWGYGIINMKGVFENIRGGFRESHSEFEVGDLFVRLPDN